jgi:glycosyltransferase involved in cell wall biosynthesis
MHGLKVDYRPTPFALEWMQDSDKDIELSQQYLCDLIAETKPDLLHFNQYAYGAIETPLPKVVAAHSVLLSWWTAVKREQPPATDWINLYHQTVRKGIAGADVVVVPSKWMMTQLKQCYGPVTHAEVIYNGRDPSLFDPNEAKHSSVVSIGRIWDEAKQVSLLAERRQAVPVTIVGERQHPDGRAIATECPPGMAYTGPQSEKDIRALFARSTIYVACSCYEPFGLAPVEAALSRCAIVANDIPTFRELWGTAAFYFNTNDADSLADAIRKLSADRALCREYANRAYDHARKHYSSKAMINKYEELYNSVLAQEAAA